MERTFRLEFNEKQQKFHLDNGTHEENTNGWITVFEHCSDIEFRTFECYMLARYKSPYKNSQVLKCALEIEAFAFGLVMEKIQIVKA